MRLYPNKSTVDSPTTKELSVKCSSTLTELVVNCDGHVAMYRYTHTQPLILVIRHFVIINN